MVPHRWTSKDIPNLSGKLAIVTGATGGLGLETCIALAGSGATVILAGRNSIKGSEALETIYKIHPSAKISFWKLDLCSLKSVSEFAQKFLKSQKTLDILVNNAGIMAPPDRQLTEDGFEIQFQTNHLSHFSLTLQLLPALMKSRGRIVNVSSMMSWGTCLPFMGVDFEDFGKSQEGYWGMGVYAQTKFANLLFTKELQRRADKEGWNLTVVAAHPGYSRTELISNGFGSQGFFGKFTKWLGTPLMSIEKENGVLPQLYAATDPKVEKGGYYGPGGIMELRMGSKNVKRAWETYGASDKKQGEKLWKISEEMCGIKWPEVVI